MMTFVIWVCMAVQSMVWGGVRIGYTRAKKRTGGLAPDPPVDGVSVIIAARNEASTLPSLIQCLDAQTWRSFEAIVVDDASIDLTAKVVREAIRTRPWLRLVEMETPVEPRKRNALAAGMKAAIYDRFVFTDADCEPGPGWLDYHAISDSSGEWIVIGGISMRPHPGLLNRFQRFMQIINCAMAGAGVGANRPFLAFGGNLSYSRKLFERVGGYGDGQLAMSGDDDLFVQRVNRSGLGSFRFLSEAPGHVVTEGPSDMASYARQKRRHLSASRGARKSVLFLGAIHLVSLIGVWAAPLVMGWFGIGLWATHLLLSGEALRPAIRDFGKPDILMWLPVLMPLYVLFNMVFPLWGLIWPPKRWEQEISIM